jgi:hypothetical protein
VPTYSTAASCGSATRLRSLPADSSTTFSLASRRSISWTASVESWSDLCPCPGVCWRLAVRVCGRRPWPSAQRATRRRWSSVGLRRNGTRRLLVPDTEEQLLGRDDASLRGEQELEYAELLGAELERFTAAAGATLGRVQLEIAVDEGRRDRGLGASKKRLDSGEQLREGPDPIGDGDVMRRHAPGVREQLRELLSARRSGPDLARHERWACCTLRLCARKPSTRVFPDARRLVDTPPGLAVFLLESSAASQTSAVERIDAVESPLDVSSSKPW